MSLKNLSATAGSNTLAPPYGAPESSTKLKDYNDLWRYLASVTRHLASSATVASAATTDLGASDETWLTISGTTTITSFGTVSAGIYKFVTFSGALTLTHNATSLILLGGANRTTVAGDCGLYVSLGSGNWKEYFYSPIGAYQPLDAQLTTLAGITAQQATDLAAVSTFIGTLLNDADASAAQTTLGISTFIKTLLDDTDAATARATLGVSKLFQSGDQAITSGGLLTLAHGLGEDPALINLRLVCTTAEGDYSIGDKIVGPIGRLDSADRGVSVWYDTTNIYLRFGGAANVFSGLTKNTGGAFLLTNANWSLTVKART